MTHLRRYLAALAVLPLFHSHLAQAQAWRAAVASGSAVMWTGRVDNAGNPNTLFIHNGNVLINNTSTFLSGTVTLVTQTKNGISKTSNFSFGTGTGDTGGAQAANTAYYVYYAQYPDGGATSYTNLISKIAPQSVGDPLSNVSYTAPDTTVVSANSNAVFLGSYVTDGTVAHDMIPFTRDGDEVIFIPSFDASTGDSVWNGNSAQFSNGDSVPEVKTVHVAGSVPIPKSATGLVLDIQALADTATNTAHMFLLDPRLILITAPCTVNMQADLKAIGNASVYRRYRVMTASGADSVSIGACAVPSTVGKFYETWISFVGYIEDPAKLSW